jgi:hypothetical protein
MHINKIHKIDGVNFVKPSDIFAKLFEAMPNEIPSAKINIQIKVSCLIIA